ncbi:hypothetical protein [Epilithonimonas hungarica]|uniref:Uncharacterized protein n=1 Tax=Epilithonimonas hungarica TaxID=454006 RepID=A0A1G7PZH6_9FLAO|nr:hypothetical protein [Epilithonimonas hungarica]SDF91621.1 hypothetical protein SAMN05421825_2465 [Epilithonimonas hungarica]
MKYSVTINSTDSEFYRNNKLILRVLSGNFYLSKSRIFGSNNKVLVIFKAFNLFFKRDIKILEQNLDKKIVLEKGNLYIDENLLVIKTKFKIIGKYEAICLLNNHEIGEIIENSGHVPKLVMDMVLDFKQLEIR